MSNFIIVEFTLQFSCFCGAAVIQVTREQVLQHVLYIMVTLLLLASKLDL